MKKKCLISVLSVNKSPWVELESTIRNTWFLNNEDNDDIIFYYGDSNKIYLEGDRLFLDSPEGLENIGYKTIKMFQYCLENFEFDYIFRTNSSSYVDLKKLNNYLIDKSVFNFYHGIIGKYIDNTEFASGCGYFLSRDIVKFVVDKKGEWDHRYIDDVALSKLLSVYGIKPTESIRIDILSDNNINTELNNFHYRCRSSDRNMEIKIMEKLYKML